MIKLIALLILLVSFPVYSQDAEMSVINDEACDQRLREVVNGMGSQTEISEDQWSNVVQSCAGRDLVLDISYQALLMLFGPQMIDALSIANAFTSAIFDYQSDIDEAEAQRISNMYPQFQYVIRGFNYVFFTIFVVFVCVRLFTVAFAAQTGSNRKSHMKDAVKKEGVTWFSGTMLLIPAGGVLSVIQYLFVSGLVFAVMISKFLATLFFIGNGGLSLSSIIEDEVADDLTTIMEKTVAYNMCGYSKRDDLIRGIQTSRGYTDSELLEDDYVKCLASPSWTPFNQTNLNVQDLALQGGLRMVDNAMEKQSIIATYGVGINAKVTSCVDDFAEDYPNVSVPSSCGQVKLQTPDTESDKANAYMRVLEDVFLSRELQQATLIVAATFYEQACRIIPVGVGSPCYRMDIGNADLPINTETNRDGTERFEYVPFNEGVLTDLRFEKIKQAQFQKIRTYLADNLPTVTAARLAAVDNGKDVAESLGVEEDIRKIRRQIDKGIWMSGVAFTNQFGQQLNTALLTEAAQRSYSLELEGAVAIAADEYAQMASSYNNVGNKNMGLLPKITLFGEVDECWTDPAYCSQVALNPFGAIVDNGVQMFDRAIVIISSNMLISKMIEGFTSVTAHRGVAGPLQIYGMVYLIIALLFVVVMPLMAMFTLLSKLLTWLKDATMVMFSLTLDVSVSPMMANEEKMVAAPIANAFKALYVLSAHLLFISIGVIVCFLLLSFLMALNVVLFGVIFYMFNLNSGGGFVDDMVFSVIRDLVIAGLLYFQVKYSIGMINKVPEALAKHYELEFGYEEPIFDKFINTINNKVAPQLFSVFSR